ncbi:MAG: diacylglycerol kinase [Malacoplasma sp.]|nr:diacylglycerol kinase [Malacoplasma sp.]MDE5949458.1 diacylglycerol kinase [Malacoplasma sp.]MDE6893951.1 diacylglycerol kinase [Malacoplasma sp.]MDE7075455.1 diacylglycerol kinase [Malacoplasma sp.]MDE7099744.1 diacylglycerol kinase [Malacoplasma sp.]
MIRTNNRFIALLKKFKYAFRGLYVAIKEEKSLIIDLIFSIIVLIIAAIINNYMQMVDWILLVVVICLVIGMELINTAIENLVDTISFKYNIDASKIKDTAAATALIFSLMAVVVGLLIFVPKFIIIIQGG